MCPTESRVPTLRRRRRRPPPWRRRVLQSISLSRSQPGNQEDVKLDREGSKGGSVILCLCLCLSDQKLFKLD